MIEATNENFNDLVKEGNVIVDFWAEWCGPCKVTKPILEKFDEENDHIKVISVDADNENDLAVNFKIRSIPTILFMKDGEMVGMETGTISSSRLEEIAADKF